MGQDWPVMDRTSRLPSRPTSVATELIRLVVRLVFFSGLVVLALVIRADETRTGERNFLLALAVLGGVLGVAMVGQSVLDLVWLRGRRQARSA
jgi:hypothetical protein